jgi:hypothetical protein
VLNAAREDTLRFVAPAIDEATERAAITRLEEPIATVLAESGAP